MIVATVVAAWPRSGRRGHSATHAVPHEAPPASRRGHGATVLAAIRQVMAHRYPRGPGSARVTAVGEVRGDVPGHPGVATRARGGGAARPRSGR